MLGFARYAAITVSLAVLAVCCTSCDLMAFTDAGYVKAKFNEYAEAVHQKNWKEAATFYDSKMHFQPYGGPVLKGQIAALTWQKSLQDIHNMDGFYLIFHDAKKIKADQVVVTLTFQAHIVLNSMTMTYDNTMWKAKVLWVKRGNALWKIGYIQELSPRGPGDPSAL